MRSNGTHYVCPVFSHVDDSTYRVAVSPSFYNYTLCRCEDGSFGVPPNCDTIPIAAPLVTEKGFKFSDSLYGQQRQASGIDVRWPIGPPNARVITVTFNLGADFKKLNDTIAVYEGDETLTGDRVATLL